MSNLASVSPQSVQGASFKGTPPNIASMSPQTLQSASFKGNLPPPVNNGYPLQSFPVKGPQGAVTGMATVRTVLVPRQIEEPYTVMETRSRSLARS